MSNIYKILRLSTRIKSRRIKKLGIWGLHILGKRYIGIFLDPVLACNFRCKMCYFSDAEKRKNLRGVLKHEDIRNIADALFHRALKLQIGCGAEPTLHTGLTEIVKLGKQYNIPYISLTTNGNLLNREQLQAMVEAGLDELTLSAHGFTRKTYEDLMVNGKFNLFCRLLSDVAEIKKTHRNFKLRINYTINNDNLDELSCIWDVVGDELDILQLRPIQNIGNSMYTDFDLTNIYHKYDTTLAPLIEECRQKNIICLVPEKQNILILQDNGADDNSIAKATYCYVSPQVCWQDDFDYNNESFESYSAKHQIGKELFSNIFNNTKQNKVSITRKMNYKIK